MASKCLRFWPVPILLIRVHNILPGKEVNNALDLPCIRDDATFNSNQGSFIWNPKH